MDTHTHTYTSHTLTLSHTPLFLDHTNKRAVTEILAHSLTHTHTHSHPHKNTHNTHIHTHTFSLPSFSLLYVIQLLSVSLSSSNSMDPHLCSPDPVTLDPNAALCCLSLSDDLTSIS